jgi:hypothetical protein
VLVQELLLEEAGLDIAQLRRLSRWGNLAPAIGAKINPALGGRQAKAALPSRLWSMAQTWQQQPPPSIFGSVSGRSSASSGSHRCAAGTVSHAFLCFRLCSSWRSS